MHKYGKAYAAILGELVSELGSAKTKGRSIKRISNARSGAWRRSLILILQTEHGMTEEQAEKAVLDSVRPWRSDAE